MISDEDVYVTFYDICNNAQSDALEIGSTYATEMSQLTSSNRSYNYHRPSFHLVTFRTIAIDVIIFTAHYLEVIRL